MSGLRQAAAAFQVRNYRLFWIGGLVSNTGRWFQAVAIPIVVYDLTESAGWVGVAGFAQIFPLAVMGPLGGAIADRYSRRRILFFAQILRAIAATGFTVMWFGGVREPEAYVAMSLVSGLTAGINLPAWQAFVSELVPRELLLSAITMNSAQFNSSRLIGPAIAGVVIAEWGPGWAFVVNSVSFVAVLISLAMIRVPRIHQVPTERMRPLREFVAAIGYARQRAGIRTAIATASLIGFFGLSMQVLAVVMAKEVFDRGDRGYGLMLSALGTGAVLSSPLVAGVGTRFRRSQVQEVALLLYGVGIVVLASAPIYELALVGLFLMGAAHITTASTLNTAIQMQVDENVRAKVLSVYLVVLMTSNPMGQLILAQVIELTGPRETIGAAGGCLFVLAGWLRFRGHLSGLDEETGVYEPAAAAEAHPSTPAPPKGYQPSPDAAPSPSDK